MKLTCITNDDDNNDDDDNDDDDDDGSDVMMKVCSISKNFNYRRSAPPNLL